MKRIKGQTGMSLVEALIILLVLMLLTGVLAPNIFEFVKDAQEVKVKEDCEAIGIETAKLVRDVGPCLMHTYADGCTPANLVYIMGSDGNTVAAGSLAGGALTGFDIGAGTFNWPDVENANYGDAMEHQFTTNAPDYPTVGDKGNFNHTYPSFGLGWRGAYLPSPIGPDPWGNKYLVNTVFLTTKPWIDGVHTGPGYDGWDNDVFCLSSGPNMLYETAFGGNTPGGTPRGGDDFTFIIQGSTR